MNLFFQEETNKIKDQLPQDQHTLLALPVYSSVHTIMARVRSKSMPKLPNSLEELQIPPSYREHKGEEFLIGEEGTNDRILMFSKSKFLRLLCDGASVFMDGTFYTCPKPFKQLYTIHTMVQSQMILVVYFLLPNKSGNV